jgi:hypothetical protein
MKNMLFLSLALVTLAPTLTYALDQRCFKTCGKFEVSGFYHGSTNIDQPEATVQINCNTKGSGDYWNDYQQNTDAAPAGPLALYKGIMFFPAAGDKHNKSCTADIEYGFGGNDILTLKADLADGSFVLEDSEKTSLMIFKKISN